MLSSNYRFVSGDARFDDKLRGMDNLILGSLVTVTDNTWSGSGCQMFIKLSYLLLCVRVCIHMCIPTCMCASLNVQ